MSNPNKILLGLIGAAALGVVVGILLAPEKGGEVRQKIADRAGDFASRIGEMITSGRDRLGQVGEDIAAKGKKMSEGAANKADAAGSSM